MHVKYGKEFKDYAEAAWIVYLLRQQITGWKYVYCIEENHEVLKGKTRM
jgi:hypothetical protein